MAPGIYFGLADDVYHADPSLGSHSVARLRYSGPHYWWESWMNPLREEKKESDAYIWGRAFHKLTLEGRSAFDESFARAPVIDEYPGCCRIVDDIKAKLAALGLPVSGNKAVLIERLKAADPEATFWDEIVAAAEAGGKTLLKPGMHAEILLSGAMISKNPHLQPSFRDGFSEVSVFWVEDGVPCKARIDYLKLKATVDLKSILTNRDDLTFDRLVHRAIAMYRYDMQCAHYQTARDMARQFVTEGKVFDMTGGRTLEHYDEDTGEIVQRPTMPTQKWLNVFAKTTDFTWVWVMFGKGGPPLAKGYEFRRDDPAFDLACDDRKRGLKTYTEFYERFGREMWLVMDPVELVTGQDLPSWLGNAA
ncbi:PD-(D/E)XK nuclease-like domain-containing protein [Hyphomicrobium sp.]|uniref:PD-(D/E)XK nuclease-like domain-containing protein n=1 Tax=Hyphomicrobium sp. TaxID=82 RepID=UPI001D38BCA0|nr:PD-(D/E)XK nuclease-like domain-containing protein [Hyphomicrobium sp.]MBY0561455.1 PD-(D/E)XK nuclease-like domain-containing protein [Hyphomicrobium sp.]